MTSLFDASPRRLSGGWDSSVGSFEYLNRSDRIAATRIRSLIDGWFAAYPNEAQGGLKRRFRSERENYGAFFELFSFATLTALGFAVEVNDLENTSRHPDFLVRAARSPAFYWECTTIKTDYEMELSPQEGTVLGALRSPLFENWWFTVMFLKVTNNLPRRAQLIHEVRTWLESRSHSDFDEDARVVRV
ncbi:MAG: hypothetical protein O2822_07710, partial [Chloroflexi bacterium]|nr:hypothetical protein [Chloroflexota bacterium]